MWRTSSSSWAQSILCLARGIGERGNRQSAIGNRGSPKPDCLFPISYCSGVGLERSAPVILGLIADNAWVDAVARMGVVGVLVPVGVIVLTWVERKVVGRLQGRLGPMRVGPYGILQGVADTIKLIAKEDVRPQTADRWTFELAPFVIVVPVFMALVSLPFTADLFVKNLSLGLFYIVAVSGIS